MGWVAPSIFSTNRNSSIYAQGMPYKHIDFFMAGAGIILCTSTNSKSSRHKVYHIIHNVYRLSIFSRTI